MDDPWNLTEEQKAFIRNSDQRWAVIAAVQRSCAKKELPKITPMESILVFNGLYETALDPSIPQKTCELEKWEKVMALHYKHGTAV